MSKIMSTNYCPLCGGEADNILDQLDISDGYTWHCEPCDNWFASIEEHDEHIAWILKNTNLPAHADTIFKDINMVNLTSDGWPVTIEEDII